MPVVLDLFFAKTTLASCSPDSYKRRFCYSRCHVILNRSRAFATACCLPSNSLCYGISPALYYTSLVHLCTSDEVYSRAQDWCASLSCWTANSKQRRKHENSSNYVASTYQSSYISGSTYHENVDFT